MSRTMRTIAAALLALAVTGTGIAAAAPDESKSDKPTAKPKKSKKFTRGARSLGDPLFPQIGNGGYDAAHYTIELDYDPVDNRLQLRALRRWSRARRRTSRPVQPGLPGRSTCRG